MDDTPSASDCPGVGLAVDPTESGNYCLNRRWDSFLSEESHIGQAAALVPIRIIGSGVVLQRLPMSMPKDNVHGEELAQREVDEPQDHGE